MNLIVYLLVFDDDGLIFLEMVVVVDENLEMSEELFRCLFVLILGFFLFFEDYLCCVC